MNLFKIMFYLSILFSHSTSSKILFASDIDDEEYLMKKVIEFENNLQKMKFDDSTKNFIENLNIDHKLLPVSREQLTAASFKSLGFKVEIQTVSEIEQVEKKLLKVWFVLKYKPNL